MQRAVLAHVADCDIFISVAAVADYRPRTVAAQKLKKSAAAMRLELERNPDILAAVAALPAAPFTVGFAAETEKLAEHAQQKRRAKHIDMIAANAVGNGQGFDREDNALQLFWAGGGQALPRSGKAQLARQLIAVIADRFATQPRQGKVVTLNAKDSA